MLEVKLCEEGFFTLNLAEDVRDLDNVSQEVLSSLEGNNSLAKQHLSKE